MAREVIVEAENEQAAILVAAEQLGIPRETALAHAKVHVLRPARRGFFGLAAQPMQARVVFELPPEDAPSEGQDQDQTLIEVAGGKIVVHPGSPDKPAVLKAGPGVLLFVNGEPQASVVYVTGDEELEAEPAPKDDLAAPEMDIIVDDTRMAAHLLITPGYIHSLKDVPPAAEVTLEVQAIPNISTFLDYDAVLAALARKGVVFGIDHRAIEDALNAAEARRVQVAAGQPAEDGADGRVEMLIAIYGDQAGGVAGDDGQAPEAGKVDYRERPEITFVEAGTPILLVHPPTEGKPGRNVLGEEVKAKPGRPVAVVRGRGVAKEDLEGGITRYTAATAGRPMVRQESPLRWVLDVSEVYVHSGDVDMSSGNVHFRGDVIIRGEVGEGMTVTAGGGVEISGNVSGGKVVAGDRVVIRGGVLQGQVMVGPQGIMQVVLRHHIRRILEQLQPLNRMVKQTVAVLRSRAGKTQVGTGQIVRTVIRNRFPGLPGQIEELLSEVAPYGPPFEDYPELNEPFYALRRLANLSHLDDINLDDLIAQVGAILSMLDLRPESEAGVEAGFVHASKISATGDIIVGVRGSYFSELRAGTHVQVKGPVIGGMVRAGKRIEVKESGSVASPPTKLIVDGDGVITIGKAHPNTRLEIDSLHHVFDVETSKVRAFVSEDRIKIGLDY